MTRGSGNLGMLYNRIIVVLIMLSRLKAAVVPLSNWAEGNLKGGASWVITYLIPNIPNMSLPY